MPQRRFNHEFYSLPTFFLTDVAAKPSVLPWLPLLPHQLPAKSDTRNITVLEEEENPTPLTPRTSASDACSPSLDPATIEKATSLKAALSNSDSTPETLGIARDIRRLCLASAPAHRLALLELVGMCEVVDDDEAASLLLSNLCDDDDDAGGGDWPAQVLCSVALPRFLSLTRPASRVLLSATVGFCGLHPAAAVDALVFPLASSKDGINAAVGDALARVVRECLHPAHVSAFCHRLLCGQDEERRVVCLPRHQGLVSDAVAWTEPMFALFQQIMNLGVRFTPDTTRRLVYTIDEAAEKFSRSLKFGNFFLCFVTKCACAAEFDKPTLERAAKKTDTFVTKSILSKLGT